MNSSSGTAPRAPAHTSPPAAFFSIPGSLSARLILFAVLLALDCLLHAFLPHPETLLAPLASFGIAAFAVFLGLGYSTLSTQTAQLPFRPGLFLGHLAALTIFCLESAAAAGGYESTALNLPTLFCVRIVLACAAVVQLALSCIPLSEWKTIRRATGNLWLYASVAGAATWLLRPPLQCLWTSRNFILSQWLQSATFASVSRLLTPLIPSLQTDPPNFILRAPNFAIFIAPECSGLEGLGLVLVFTLAWLTWFRRDFRFPRAFLLIPVALVAVWLLNILRIAALMLIGNSVSPEVALAGFHSQAGWIAFTLVALAFSVAAHELRWIRNDRSRYDATPASIAVTPAASSGESPATPAYLLPFLAILAASFFSKAASGAFEWLYPLRLFAALAVLFFYRRSYRAPENRAEYKPIWGLRFSWLALLAGVAIGLIWIFPTLWQTPSEDPIASGLALLSPVPRFAWIACRLLAAILTVPIAEELAFRGFLARRFITRDFDSLPYNQLTLLPTLISSFLFGLMHGTHWIAGTIAGLVFALLARFRNRLDDAIVAHAAGNLVIAVWVLARGDFSLW